jgi:hypothetical protein
VDRHITQRGNARRFISSVKVPVPSPNDKRDLRSPAALDEDIVPFVTGLIR